MRLIYATMLAIAALMLPGCAVAEDKAPDYRYRLTVEVETPEGVKTGSSVIQVEQTLGRASGAPASSQIYTRVRGEAVAVSLPGGQTLLALLRSESSNDWAAGIVPALAPRKVDPGGAPRFDSVLLLEGKVEVPRTLPPVAWIPRRSAYPMLVTFSALADPTSVKEVDPDDLAATFGEGVTLKRITVELTDDQVTTGIEKRLVWLSEHPEPRLDPNYRGSTNPNLSQSLWHGDFRKRQRF